METPVEKIPARVQELLAAGPRSRDSVERILGREGVSPEAAAAVLGGIDWTGQALAVAKGMEAAGPPRPDILKVRLFVDGFTEDEIAAAIGHYDWQELIRIALKDMQELGVSRTIAGQALVGRGYAPEDAEAVLSSLDERFWENQAVVFLRHWADAWDSRSQFMPRKVLHDAGFTSSQIDFAAASLEPDLREIARREAQAMHDAGIEDSGIALAFEFAGFPPDVASGAVDSIERSSKSLPDRRLEHYLSMKIPRTARGLRESLGNLSNREREELYARHGVRDIDWAQLNQSAISEVLDRVTGSRADVCGLLKQLEYEDDAIDAAVRSVDWGARAAAEAQDLIDAAYAFSDQDLVSCMKEEGYSDEEIDAARQAVVWPADYPDDPVVAKLRGLYMDAVPLAEAVPATAAALGVPEEVVQETADALELDWEAPLLAQIEDYFRQTERPTPAGLVRAANSAAELAEPGELLARTDHDWTPDAVNWIEFHRQQGVPDSMIMMELRKAGFNHETMSQAAEKAGLAHVYSVDAVVQHMRNLLAASTYSLAGIRSELQNMGYVPELIGEAEAQLEPELKQTDWQRRALEWIRSEGEKRGLSRSETRSSMLRDGYDRREVAWAMGKSRTDYAQNAVTRAERMLSGGADPRGLAGALRSAGFTAAEITRAVNTIGF